MLLQRFFLALTFCALAASSFGQDNYDTTWFAYNKMHASFGFEFLVSSNTYESYQPLGTESVYFSQIQGNDITSDPEYNMGGVHLEVGYERIVDFRKDKKWFPWLGIKGNVRTATFTKKLNANQSNFQVIDTLTNSFGEQFIRGEGSELFYDVNYSVDMVSLGASVRCYLYRNEGARYSLFTGVGITQDFGVRSKLSTHRSVSNYLTIDSTYFSVENKFDTENVSSQEYNLTALSLSIGVTFKHHGEIRYAYKMYVSDNDLVPFGSAGHQVSFTLTPYFGKKTMLRYKSKKKSGFL